MDTIAADGAATNFVPFFSGPPCICPPAI